MFRTLAEYSTSAVDGREHVRALATALPTFGRALRAGIGRANDFGDLVTADLFTEVARGIDERLWFVEAHMQPER